MDIVMDSTNVSKIVRYLKSDESVNLVNFYSFELIVPYVVFCAIVLLAFLEVRVKLDAKALRILLNKDRNIVRKILLINFAQTVLLVSIEYLNLTTPELRAASLYVLLAKLVQIRSRDIVIDLPSILSTALFFFLAREQSQFSVLEVLDSCVNEVILFLFPSVLISIMLLILPVVVPVVLILISLSAVCGVLWMIVLVRRKYQDDFDFFVTVAICVLAWKIIRKELVQRQVKNLVCARLPSRQVINALTNSNYSPVIYDPTGLEKVMKWCEMDEQPFSVLPGHYESLRDLKKPENVTYLDFYMDIATNYRMTNIFQSLKVRDGCLLTVSKAPRESGLRGVLQSTLYRLYLLAAWILPNSYQHHLSVFGFSRSPMLVKSESDCEQLAGQIILEKING